MNLKVIGVALGILAGLARSQTKTPAPAEFEVASIKPCRSEAGRTGGDGNGPSTVTLRLPCQTLMRLIQGAYVFFAHGRMNIGLSVPITGGPGWVNSDLYQIDAKAGAPQSHGIMNGPMLQALLEDRFKLKIHREISEGPVYALTVAKGGPKLLPLKEGVVRM
jgi:uncharacterized protein (TIGR03435 family)